MKTTFIKGTSGSDFCVWKLSFVSKIINFYHESFHEIFVIEWYYGKAALIFAIKVPKINCQLYHVLEMLSAERKA